MIQQRDIFSHYSVFPFAFYSLKLYLQLFSFYIHQIQLRTFEGKITKNDKAEPAAKANNQNDTESSDESSDSDSDSDDNDSSNNNNKKKLKKENPIINKDHLLVSNQHFAFTTGSNTSIIVKGLQDDAYFKEVKTQHPFLLVEFYPGSISPPPPANNTNNNENNKNGKKKRKKSKKNKGSNNNENSTNEETAPAANNPEQEDKNSPKLFFLSTLDGDSPSASKKTHFAVTSIESGLTVKEHTVSESWYLDQYPVKSAGFLRIPIEPSSTWEHWEIFWRQNQINFWDMAKEKEYMAMDTVR